MGRFKKSLKVFCAALFCFAILTWAMDWSSFLRELKHISVSGFLVCVALEWFFYAVETRRLHTLAQGQYPYSLILKSRLISVFWSHALPGFAVGEAARLVFFESYRQGRKVWVLSLLLANRIFGLLGLLPLLGLSVLKHQNIWIGSGATVACVAISGLPLLWRLSKIRGFALMQLRRLPWASVKRSLFQVYSSLKHMAQTQIWILALASSTVTGAIVVLQYTLLSHAVGLNFSFDFWLLWAPLISLSAFLPLGIGAVGPQDFSLIGLAHMTGAPVEKCVALSVLVHAMRFCGSLPGGGWFLLSGMKSPTSLPVAEHDGRNGQVSR